MTMRSFTRRSALAASASLSAVTLSVALVQPAMASPPQRIPVDETETFNFPLCGIDTLVVLREVGTLTIRGPGAGGHRLLHGSPDS